MTFAMLSDALLLHLWRQLSLRRNIYKVYQARVSIKMFARFMKILRLISAREPNQFMFSRPSCFNEKVSAN